MGELILCTHNIAANSFYIEGASLNVYSLEELSYYIYNNSYLLDETFVSPSLCNWIEKELHDKALASEIYALIGDNVGLNVIVGHLLRSNGYLTKAEIKRCLEIISSFEGKTEAESRKLRADHMMRDGRLSDAVFSYEMILDKNLPMEDTLKGNIMHNLGCALCGLFFYSRASLYFEKAYRLNRNKESLNRLLLSLIFADDTESFNIMADRYQVLPEEIEDIKNLYLETINSKDNERFYSELNNRLISAKDDVEREFIFDDLMGDIKRDYRSIRTV